MLTGEKMEKRYLIDTNAFFHILQELSPDNPTGKTMSKEIKDIVEGNSYISTVTKIEIISVLGKYSRGVSGGPQRCTSCIDDKGTKCTNSKYVKPRKKWNNKKVKAWLKLINEVINGKSKLFSVGVESFDGNTIAEAEKIVQYALKYNFASMDALIVATASIASNSGKEGITIVTSDKGMKACLSACGMPVLDPFATQSIDEIGA